eukprot:TRINITY_DN9122_c0_g1_i6.p1 TRINITY_DN9122_c0_g1~~TRINITY_DN9122_c0_g1_i6.p1  ORF type:complete len:681 (+),score=117.59 TRINITY_DN9122_c0_g1_i6:144-2186(+)
MDRLVSDESSASDEPFIAEDNGEDGASGVGESFRASGEVLGKPRPDLAAARVPAAVQEILCYRRSDEGSIQKQASSGLPSEAWTNRFRDFCEEAGRYGAATPARQDVVRANSSGSRSSRSSQNLKGLRIKTYLDLQSYDIDGFADKLKEQPGSLQLMYMFYSRIFEKLVGKQRGVDVRLFDKIDHSERLLGFRGILEWAHDFKLCPSRVGRRELERIYAEVHQGNIDSPRKKFESKITYHEFVDFVCLCADAGEPMDRSQLDGSRARGRESRLDKLRRLVQYLQLPSTKKVRMLLHNAYRDVHFWKLSDGADFEKEARAAEMRSRPQHRVDAVPPDRRLHPVHDAVCRRYLQQFTWVSSDQIWEEFQAPVLDMGTSVVSGRPKRFRLLMQNCMLTLAKVRVEAEDCGPLKLPWRDTTVGPGQSIEVLVDFVPVDCGEWCGKIVAVAAWPGGESEESVVPTYARVVSQQSSCATLAKRLPHYAPRPFRPGSAKRVSVDPASMSANQMQSVAPGSSRPGSASSAGTGAIRPVGRPTSATRSASLGGRPGSAASQLAVTSTSRPGSGRSLKQLPPTLPMVAKHPSYPGQPPLPPTLSPSPWSKAAADRQQRGRHQGSHVSRHWSMPAGGRPHSAPSVSPERKPVTVAEDNDDSDLMPTAAGAGAAAARVRRPQSAGGNHGAGN